LIILNKAKGFFRRDFSQD